MKQHKDLTARKLFILPVFLLFLAATGFTQDRMQQIDSLFSNRFQKNQFNGYVLIAENGKPAFSKGYGFAELSTQKPLTESTCFELASVSKQFTAMGIALLEKKGMLQFEDSIKKFFPALPYENVTIRQLLNHCSGVPDYMDIFRLVWDSSKIATNRDMIEVLARSAQKTTFKPGEKFEYSNTGYALLASVIEKVSGKSFAAYMQDNIFRPLGMKNTRVLSRRLQKYVPENFAYGYVRDSAGNWVLPDVLPETRGLVYAMDGIQGDGTVCSSAEDLFKWESALRSGKLLPVADLNKLYVPTLLNSGKKNNYAFGWVLDSLKNAGRMMNHSGGWPGYRTFIERHTDNNKLIIVLTNKEAGNLPLRQVRNILYGIIEVPVTPKMVSADTLAMYKGDYELMPGFSIKVWTDNGQLKAQGTGQDSFGMEASSTDLFIVRAVDAKIKFNRDQAGKVISLTLFQGGQEITGTKKD